MSTLKLDKQEVNVVSDFIMESCGVSLDETKDYLIEARLGEICKELSLKSYTSLIAKARNESRLTTEIVNAITTNETLFFRDDSPFKALQHKAMPELIDAKEGTAGARRIRIWSAACSTGQEVYSIAMTLHELIPDIHAWDIKIIGSDVSSAAIEKASRGVYTRFETERGLQTEQLQKHFCETQDGWRINDEIRVMCSFEHRDLTKPLIGIGPFDVVFCRNVAIYFTPECRRQLFERIVNNMTSGGYLFVGSSECLSDLGYEPQHHCRSVFYRPTVKCG